MHSIVRVICDVKHHNTAADIMMDNQKNPKTNVQSKKLATTARTTRSLQLDLSPRDPHRRTIHLSSCLCLSAYP